MTRRIEKNSIVKTYIHRVSRDICGVQYANFQIRQKEGMAGKITYGIVIAIPSIVAT